MMVFMRMMMMMMLMMMVVTMMVTMEVNTWRCFDQRAPTTGCRRSSSPGRPINKHQKLYHHDRVLDYNRDGDDCFTLTPAGGSQTHSPVARLANMCSCNRLRLERNTFLLQMADD